MFLIRLFQTQTSLNHHFSLERTLVRTGQASMRSSVDSNGGLPRSSSTTCSLRSYSAAMRAYS